MGDDVKSTGNKGIFIDTQLLHTVNRAFSSFLATLKRFPISIK